MRPGSRWPMHALLAGCLASVALSQTSVITYHNDNQRTGWNSHETILTPARVATSFGHIVTVNLDDQVDTQPLVVANQTIAGETFQSVVYVTTEGNSLYAIDGAKGEILLHRNLGPPVPRPLGCTNNGPTVGINGTATIDPVTGTLYVLAYTLSAATPRYELHAINISTLADRPGSPVVVSASQTIDGTTYTFDASLQRQRPGLLDSQGKIFAGFGSFCDLSAPMTFSPPHLSAGPRKSGSHSRGWLLGWDKATLALELPHELTNRLSATNKSPCVWELKEPCYLSSIWMSGFGLASDSTGDIYFTTGNTAAGTYDSTLNIAESAVRISSNLTRVVDFFTPSNHDAMDTDDYDYGSGGLMVLPDQPGPFPHLAAGAGKDGRMFLLNRDSMGGLNTPDIPSYVSINGCWCGPSYFESSEGPLVVSSGGTFKEAATGKVTDDRVRTWALVTSGPAPKLVEVASSQVLEATGQNPGFFTSVSSDGTAPNTAIIWAVGRAAGTDHHLTLYAFDAAPSGTLLPLLWSGAAGSWPNTGGNANIIPTVADGRVFVASNQQLQIFGLVAH